MKKLCFILAVMMIFVLGFATLASANGPTLPPQSQAPLHSHIHAQPEVIEDSMIGTFGIIMPPVEI